MAKAIRSASSESYDLAGFTPASAGDLLTAAFGTPVEAAEMFRVTLVVGGGKKARAARDARPSLLHFLTCNTKKTGSNSVRSVVRRAAEGRLRVAGRPGLLGGPLRDCDPRVRRNVCVTPAARARDHAAAHAGAVFARDAVFHTIDDVSSHALCFDADKHQHDTDKDLRFVHVFPRVDTTAAEAAAAAAAAEAAPAEATPPLTQLLIASPEVRAH